MARTGFGVVTVVFLVLPAAILHAGPVVPAGLNPGDSYHLVFVTGNVTNATSSDISVYNAFVNAEAAQNPALTGTDVGVNWFAIGSTSSVHARDNAVVGATTPVYLLDGTTLVATGFADFWDGSLLSSILRNQFLTAQSGEVFTGSDINGFAASYLGGLGGQTTTGHSSSANSGWIERDLASAGASRSLFALSERLAVAPEPATITSLSIGCLLLGFAYRRRLRGQTAPQRIRG